MLLRRLTLKNFKAFKAATFDLAPLTVFIGPNNAGKSSVLHSLALLAQSSQDSSYHALSPSKKDRPTHFAELVDLGEGVAELIHGQSSEGFEIALEWSLSHGDIGRYDVANSSRFQFKVSETVAPLELHTALSCSFTNSSGDQVTLSADYPPSGPAKLNLGSKFEHAMQTHANSPWTWALQPTHNWPAELKETPLPETETSTLALFAPFFQAGLQAQLGIFDYVGPDRHVTSHAYPSLDAPSENPRTAAQVINTLAYERQVRDRVSKRAWDVFKFNIDTQPIPPKQFALVAVDEDGHARNAVNVGTGVPQLAWIALHQELTIERARRKAIVSGFSPTPIVGVEEPELHLHPRLQANVAKLLVDFLPQGQILCTTQSEHFLIAVLQFVLEGTLTPDQLGVYFVENGRAERLEVDDKGRLAGGLRGFFEANEIELMQRLDALIKPKR